MNITVLNGNPDAGNASFDSYIENLADRWRASTHEVEVLDLRDMDIKDCAGCFECWVESPGLCRVDDDSHQVCRRYIGSDLVLFASPLIMGFTSALLKKATDKLVPLLPYQIEIVDGEMHHSARYERYPRTALLMEKEADTDDEDIEIVSDIYARDAVNLKTTLAFARLTSDPIEEVARELTVFNGSPRYKKSSTKIITDQFAEGFLETQGNIVETEYLVQKKYADRFVEVFGDADQVLLAFPLYHDSMPSIVKDFIESLAPLRGRTDNPRMLFSAHSGFAEALHSRYVERYVRKLTRRLGSECAGAILPGSVHRIEDMPAMMTKSTLGSYRELGRIFGETGELDGELLSKLAKPERFTGATLQLMKVAYSTGLGNRGWDNLAKKAGTYEQRLARPYTD